MSWEVMVMRSTASSNEVKTIIKYNFKKFWTVPALALFWFLVWGFLPVMLTHAGMKWVLEMLEMLSLNENFGYASGIILLAVASGMAVFSYLQHPGASNYIHSLPIDRNRLFAANLLSGLLMIAGPILVNGVLMTLLAGNPMFVRWMIVTAVSCFAIYAVTVFAATISGNTLMHLFNSAFFNCIASLIMLVFYVMCSELLLGYEPSERWLQILQHSNALTAFIGGAVSAVSMCVLYFLVGIAAVLAGWMIYRRRPVERAGDSVIFPWTRTVLFLICIFCGASLVGILFASILTENGIVSFNYMMVIGILAGAIFIYVVGSLMIDRSAKIFTKRNMLPAAAALVLALAVLAGVDADITGYGSYVPQSKEVKAVYLDTGSSELFEATGKEDIAYSFRANGNYYKKSRIPTLKMHNVDIQGMTSEESIDAVLALQQALISQDRSKGYISGSVDIVYELKSGKQVRRQYDLVTEAEEPTFESFAPEIVKAAQKVYESQEFKQKYSLMNVRPEFFDKGKVFYYPEGFTESEDSEEGFYAVPKQYVPGLQKALEQDFQECGYYEAMHTEGLVSVTSSDTITDTDGYSYNKEIEIPVISSGKHTRAWLKEHKDILQ